MAQFNDLRQMSVEGQNSFTRGQQQTNNAMRNRLLQLDVENAPRQQQMQNRLADLKLQAAEQAPTQARQAAKREILMKVAPSLVQRMQQEPERAQELFARTTQGLAGFFQQQGLSTPEEAAQEAQATLEQFGGVDGFVTAFGGVQKDEGQPSTVQEWEYFNSLSEQDQKRFLTMKRANKVVNIGDVPAQVDPVTNTANPVNIPGIKGSTQPEIQDELTRQEADKQAAITRSKQTVEAEVNKKLEQAGAMNKLDDAKSIFTALENADLDLIYGRGESLYPDLLRSQEGIDLMAQRTQLVSMLKLGARGELKGQGPITDAEQSILSDAVTVLSNLDISPTLAREHVKKAKGVLLRNAGKAQQSKPEKSTYTSSTGIEFTVE